MTDLHLDFCGHEAARYACAAWHYSHAMPASRRVCVGAWEDDRFIGAIVFSRGNTPNIARPFHLTQARVCELTRIALCAHVTPTSRIVAIALRLLRRQSPGLKLVVSYSDPQHGHDGRGVYAAGHWLYLGITNPEALVKVHGRLRHPRTVGSRYGHRGIDWLRAHVDARAERLVTMPKYKYAYPFDADVRAQLLPLVQPYPTRPKEQASATFPAGLGSATLTRPLHQDEGANV